MSDNTPQPDLDLDALEKLAKDGSTYVWTTEILTLIATLRALQAERDRLREALRLCDCEGERAHNINAPEDAEVGFLCERVGYGAVMDAAARLWFRKDPIGALVVGPCAGTVRAALAASGEGDRNG